MHRTHVAAIVGGTLFLAGGAAAYWETRTPASPATFDTTRSTPGAVPAAQLEFRELLESGPRLRPSAKAQLLNGQRVRLVGFMAEMEAPIRGGFYLVSHPLSLDESGAGTGDLPLDSVLVLVPGAEGKVLPHVPGALEGTGMLEVGNQSDAEGRISNFRLHLDADQRLLQSNKVALSQASQ